MDEPSSPAIEALGLTKRFEDTVAVAGVDLRVGPGRVHGMLGPNGAGKTTLLTMLMGLVRPDAGSIRILGRTREEFGARVLDGVAGFVESPRFYPYLSGRRNLTLLAELDGGPAASRIDEALELVDLRDQAGAKVGGYSVGMRQRLGIAGALLRDPRLLILDEPASGLDPAGMRDMRALVARLAGDGVTVLLSSHDMGEVEELCDDVTIMRRGGVVFDGSMERLRERAPDPAFRLATSDDERALTMAGDTPGVAAAVAGRELIVHAQREHLDEYVIALGRAGVAVRRLDLESSPLEALFFALTEAEEPKEPAPDVPQEVAP
ncbi:ABC transporter ATP-binding protein [Actinoallomurus purpureus]|uniref:ABC transporter ATP-binding protein n=1 Tax=Actinoallomurus purpureus TaxID=478114 RepID=UPI0020938EFF|nr:ABC transporter ATP-binding protein [Actinoallomurus purpureus]MCO6008627.1 ABC transporter ATP-binding protein [Actinoallomurus purpureus]